MTYSRAPKDEVGVSLRVIFGCGVAAKTSYKATTSRRYLRNSYANRHGGIYDLPNELILHIVSYIKNHSTLHNLSLVSITFNGISTASLYHTYKNRESEETNALLDGLSLRSFLRLILTNSRLASLVKKVDLGLWQTRFDVKSLDFYHSL
jgi:DNA-binding MltR family transcriptional regulator